jgi:hypothetical protein
MPSLFVKKNGVWNYPSKVSGKKDGVIKKVSTVWRKNNGTWIKHWPAPVNMALNSVNYGMPLAGAAANSSYSGATFAISSAAFGAGKIPHITTVSAYQYSAMNRARKDGDPWGSKGMGFAGAYSVVSNSNGVYAGSPVASSTAYAPNAYTYLQYPTYGGVSGLTVPTGHVLTGFSWTLYANVEDGSWNSFLSFNLLTAPLYKSGGVPVTAADLIQGSTATVSTANYSGLGFMDSSGWSGGVTTTIPLGNIVTHVDIGYGLTRGQSNLVITLISVPTTIQS